MIVIVIESDLAPGDDLGMLCQSLHRLVSRVIREPGLMRMNPDGCVQERILVRELNSGIERWRAVAVANGDDRPNSCRSGVSDHLFAIGVELLAVEMRVRIYKHG